MTAAATSTNISHFHSTDLYDPDECVPRNSPLLEARRNVRLSPSPSPPPSSSSSPTSPSTSPGAGKSSHRRARVEASQGDAVVVDLLGGGNVPEIAQHAGEHLLYTDSSAEESLSNLSEDEAERRKANTRSSTGASREDVDKRRPGQSSRGSSMSLDQSPTIPGETGLSPSMKRMSTSIFSSHVSAQERRDVDLTRADAASRRCEDGGLAALKNLAAGALGALSLASPESETEGPGRTPTSEIMQAVEAKRKEAEMAQSMPTPQDDVAREGRPQHRVPAPLGLNTPYSPPGVYSPQSAFSTGAEPRSPGPLPPIHGMASPRSDGSAGPNSLPSIREQLGDLSKLPEPGAYAHSPPGSAMPRFSMNPGSPPISPNDGFRRDHPSPAQQPPPSYYYQTLNGGPPRGLDFGGHDLDSPKVPTAVVVSPDRMSIDGLTNHAYVCKVPGCRAPAFQTQYLLNSHANVHSQERPHYCPVKGCPRSEGGKGFKRKNEMIRHGLVHDSPGYVCPFCPDREHKYPRPDNLQRHVRVHHVDKDKDDPALREVLAQRPDGPSRGRRRRGAAMT